MIISIFPNEEEAKKIAVGLLEERFVACVNIIPRITSLYWWEDSIQQDNEVIAYFKTKKENEKQLIEKIKSLHSYDIPAIFAVDSMNIINPDYLNWIKKEVK